MKHLYALEKKRGNRTKAYGQKGFAPILHIPSPKGGVNHLGHMILLFAGINTGKGANDQDKLQKGGSLPGLNIPLYQ